MNVTLLCVTAITRILSENHSIARQLPPLLLSRVVCVQTCILPSVITLSQWIVQEQFLVTHCKLFPSHVEVHMAFAYMYTCNHYIVSERWVYSIGSCVQWLATAKFII